jgi:hypothetical protein
MGHSLGAAFGSQSPISDVPPTTLSTCPNASRRHALSVTAAVGSAEVGAVATRAATCNAVRPCSKCSKKLDAVHRDDWELAAMQRVTGCGGRPPLACDARRR